MEITSLNNDLVKYYKKLMNSKKERDQANLFIVEGEHLVAEAINENIVEEIMISDSNYDHFEGFRKIYVTVLIMKKICNTVSPQGVIALCRQKNSKLTTFNRLLLLDDIQDPGNLGTIIRSADAFNFDGIIMSEHTTDVYSPKVIRATQGSLFRVNIMRTNLSSYMEYLKQKGVKVYGTSLEGENLSLLEKSEKMAFILGNEGNGVDKLILGQTDGNILIEMSGNSESLNVAIASAIIMYNFRK